VLKPWDGENQFLERMYKLEQFRQLYLASLKEFSGTIFKPERFYQQVDEVATAIRSAVAEESPEKLTRFDAVVAGDNIQPRSEGRPSAGFPIR